MDLLKQRFENRAIIFQAHVRELFDLRRLLHANPIELRNLVDVVNSHLRALEALGSKEEINSIILFHLIRSKIDEDTLGKWDDDFGCDKLPSWDLFSKFISKRCITLENKEINSRKSFNFNKNEKKATSHTVFQQSKNCPGCKEFHNLFECTNFLTLDPLQRYLEAKKFSLCIVCLQQKHSVRECNAPRCSSCHGSHHLLLHRDDYQIQQHKRNLQNKNIENKNNKSNNNSLFASSSTNLLATAILLIKNSSGNYIKCRALLDSGSQLNFITNSLVSQLQLPLQSACVVINGIADSKTNVIGKVSTTVKSRLTDFSQLLEFMVLSEITQYSPQGFTETTNFNIPKNIKLADPEFYKASNVDMLLGVSIFFKLLCVGQIELGDSLPLLQKSVLGWIVAGNYNCSQTNSLHTTSQEINNREEIEKCEM